ncbi:MAG: hypothetical protein H7X99_11025, partial [Saprospiraceae bacterium]|nr:hypothetical protein [Saprospiraceae bacterium]
MSSVITQDKVFEFNFNDCTFEDASVEFPGITPGGNPTCECGINGKSYHLDGTSDFLTVSNLSNSYLSENFTLDFYFWLDQSSGEIDIFSHRNGCSNLDSLMALRYFSTNNEILFEISSNVNNYFSVRAPINNNICWHRFTLVKFNLEYLVYLDNKLIKKIISRENIVFSKLAEITFANSPCTTAQKLNGRIDEISLFGRALSEIEIKGIYYFPDQIVTDNTTIFKGESITLET